MDFNIVFINVFDSAFIYDIYAGIETDKFKAWHFNEESFVLHKPSMTCISIISYMGRYRSVWSNKKLKVNDIKDFFVLFKEELDERL